MNNTQAENIDGARAGAGIKSSTIQRMLHKLVIPSLALLAVGMLASTAEAQFVHLKSSELRVTVPVNTTLSSVVTNLVSLSGINGSGAALNVVGLPAGAGAVLSPSIAPVNNTAVQMTINTTNVAEGTYTFGLTAAATDTNGNPQTNILLFTLQVGFLWNGGTNVAVNGPSTFSDPTKWINGITPGASDDLIFSDLGGQSAAIIGGVLTPNIIIDSNTTNASARFSQTNANRFYTIQLTNGATWALTGINGFSMLRDFVDSFTTPAITQGQTVTIFGTNGATLVISNEQASASLLIDNSAAHTLDFSGLDNFVTDINQFNLGNYLAYPNFFNIDENTANNAGITSGQPSKFLTSINFAKTNVVKAIFVDPFNFTNSNSRQYSLSFLNSEISGSTTKPVINLGISNLFQLDSINLVGGNQQATLQFNPALRITTNLVGGVTNLITNSMSAVFRGTNGGRMSMFCISDGGGTNTASGGIKATIDFSTSGGTLDLLSDRFIIGRDRALIASNNNPNYQGFLVMGNGTIDVNTAILGFRENVQTNTTPPTFPVASAFFGYCEGRVTVLSNGTFKVNQLLTLGSTVEPLSVPQGLGSGGNTEYGEVSVANGSTLNVKQVNVGGPVFGASLNNYIVISNNSTLILSNTIGGPLQSLDNMIVANGSTVTMNIDGANPGPYIFTTNLITPGTNTLKIASIKNLGSITGPIQLFTFSGTAGSFQNLVMPAGVGGALLSSNNGVFLQILQGTPKHIVWRGFSSQNWDLTTQNWLDLSTGLHTNFANGDFVSFDDDASTPTTIHLSGAIDIIPGSIGMTNNLNAYTIDSAPTDSSAPGDTKGSAVLTKMGTNSLDIEGNTTFNVNLNQGTLLGFGSGSIGSAVVAVSNVMNFTGNVANGITCAGVATIAGSGAGSIVVQSTGIVTNAGSFIGTFSLSSGAQFYNNGTLGASDIVSWTAVGNPTVSAGSTFVNSGDIHSLTLTINGTFEDKGTGTLFINGDVQVGTRGFTVAQGGLFIPGGDGIGTTTIERDFSDSITNGGRVLFSTGSTNIFKIDPSGPANTEMLALFMGWGPNQSAASINGGTIIISNTTGAPFVDGQTFALVRNAFITGPAADLGLNTTNSFPIIVPSTPGPGLAWDLSGIIHQGILGVRAVTIAPTNLLSTVSFGTSVTTNGSTITTNRTIITELQWPTNYIGWELQTQSGSLANGIRIGASNWNTVVGSSFTNDVIITTTNAVLQFFRMVYP